MKVEQHMYTRARRGIFRQSEGYDTIAVSAGLTNAFIKENVHPYCTYSPSRMLQKMNAPARDYPKAISIVHFPCGRMLLGQAVYIASDFTGQRTTFFAHHYILPPEMVADVLADIGSFLPRVKFLTEYDTAQGGVLDALDCLPVSEKHHGLSDAAVPQNIDLEKIMYKIDEAVTQSKKCAVIVDIEQKSMSEAVFGILSAMYKILPEHLKHKLGVCTYAREFVGRKGLHLTFLERDCMTVSDLRLKGDFVIIKNAEETGYDTEGRLSYLKESLRQENHPLALWQIKTLPYLSPEKFFQETNFWKSRIKTLINCNQLQTIEQNWLNKILEHLTPYQLAAIPSTFIISGKRQSNPEIYVILTVLKTISGALISKSPIDIRYILGSYSLSPTGYERTIQNLRRIHQPYVTSQNIENITFLFRARKTGMLDKAGLDTYMEEFALTHFTTSVAN